MIKKKRYDDALYQAATSRLKTCIIRFSMTAHSIIYRPTDKHSDTILIVVFPCMLIITQLLFQQNALVY
jgi:hypothetical protein